MWGQLLPVLSKMGQFRIFENLLSLIWDKGVITKSKTEVEKGSILSFCGVIFKRSQSALIQAVVFLPKEVTVRIIQK